MSKHVWELKKVTTNTHCNMQLSYIVQLNVDFVTGFCIKMVTLYSLVLFILQQTPLSCCLTHTNWHSCYSVSGYLSLPQQSVSLPFRATAYHETTFDNHWWSTQISTPATIYQHSKIKALCYFKMSLSFNATIQRHILEGHYPQISPCLLTLYFLPLRQATRLIKYGSQEGWVQVHSFVPIKEAWIHSSGS